MYVGYGDGAVGVLEDAAATASDLPAKVDTEQAEATDQSDCGVAQFFDQALPLALILTERSSLALIEDCDA